MSNAPCNFRNWRLAMGLPGGKFDFSTHSSSVICGCTSAALSLTVLPLSTKVTALVHSVVVAAGAVLMAAVDQDNKKIQKCWTLFSRLTGTLSNSGWMLVSMKEWAVVKDPNMLRTPEQHTKRSEGSELML